jgi:hypothetical protein
VLLYLSVSVESVMPANHRDTDARVCGAQTTVQNQSSVYVNGLLWAVDRTTNNHGDGQLIPTGQTVEVEGKRVIVHTPDHADPDDLCPIPPTHCDPMTAQGSPDDFTY